jgi:hypothetical protein
MPAMILEDHEQGWLVKKVGEHLGTQGWIIPPEPESVWHENI